MAIINRCGEYLGGDRWADDGNGELVERAKERLGLFAACAGLILAIHAVCLNLPYYWDELGQFIPAALDIYRHFDLIPKSAQPNVHPPGTMFYLACVWRVVGYSIVATRCAMLMLAACGVVLAYNLGSRLATATVAALAIGFLFCDPLFYAQSMMAQLDMPAMVCVLLALILFLRDRHFACAVACTASALTKETSIVLPLVLMLVMVWERRWRQAVYYVIPAIALSVWLFALSRATGTPFGNAEFAHYNLNYSLNPLRCVFSLSRRAYYLFVQDFRFVGAIAMVVAWRIFKTRAWRVTMIFAASHIVLVSVLGGAELERYLLPVLPIFYIAAAAALLTFPPRRRNVCAAVVCVGLVSGVFIKPLFPLPYEDSFAVVDFARLQQTAAGYLEANYAAKKIYTAWPLTAALGKAEYGYVTHPLNVAETFDLKYSILSKLNPKDVDVLVLYPRTWEPVFWILRLPVIGEFLTRFYEYEPQMTSEQARSVLKLTLVKRWERRGQWVEIWAKP
jgi:4-amino-4-deoxy-L-arabinose transferase-like glycosyltransferase